MTKKHFIALADAVKKHNKFSGTPFNSAQLETLADFYQSQNPLFNRERWLGFINDENGPSGGTVKGK